MTCLISSVPFYSGPQQYYKSERNFCCDPHLKLHSGCSRLHWDEMPEHKQSLFEGAEKNHLARCSVCRKPHTRGDVLPTRGPSLDKFATQFACSKLETEEKKKRRRKKEGEGKNTC